MTRAEIIGDCTLHLGDALELMPTLDKVQAIVTDPPYPVTRTSIHHYTNPGMLRSGWMGAQYPVNQEIMFELPPPERWAPLLFDVGDENAELYLMSNDRNLSRLAELHYSAGWKHHNLLVWKKPTGIPNRWYFKDAEFCLYLFKGKAATICRPGSQTTFECGHPQERLHVSEKPLALIAHYVSNTRGTVLDPFMGSGTTGVACLDQGRRFIGIEKDAGTFDIACKRIEQRHREPRLFTEPIISTEQLGLFEEEQHGQP